MSQTQQHSLRIESVDAARALRQQHDLLRLFVQPQSPTQVAGRADMAPNLLHHHARKLSELGLLFEQRREGRKVYYQLTAREFRVPSNLLPPQDEEGNGTASINHLRDGFLRAYEQSWAFMRDDEEDILWFGEGTDRPVYPPMPADLSSEPHPTHLDELTLRLSPERYRRLARALSALLTEAANEGHSPDGPHCTLAILAFKNHHESDKNRLSRHFDSFLGLD